MPSTSSVKQGVSSGSTGSLQISIPTLAPWLKKYQSATKGNNAVSSRAIAITTQAKVTVTESDGTTNVVNPVTSSVATTLESGSTVSLSLPNIPAGSGYIVTLSLYNTNSSSSAPTVTGKATGVSVSAGGTTSLTILCTPASPTALTVSQASDASVPSNGEAWYSLAVTAGTTYYVYNENGATCSNMVLGVFDGSGNYQDSEYNYIEYTPTVSGTAYMVAVNENSATEASAIVGTTTRPVLNQGSASSPCSLGSIPTGSSLSYAFKIGPYSSATSNQDTSYYSFTTSDAGDYYLDSSLSSESYYTGTLYSNSKFITITGSMYPFATNAQMNTCTGGILKGLAANTTYYLELQNCCSLFASFTGTLMTPAAVSAATKNNDGSYSSGTIYPISLNTALSTECGKVGYHSYDKSSYYSWTNNSLTSQNYLVAINNGSAGNLFIDVCTGASSFITAFTAKAGQSATSSSFTMPAGSTYYIVVMNASESSLVNYSYGLPVVTSAAN
jgi:hypothetical protein